MTVGQKEQFMVSQNNNQNNGKIEINGRTYQTVAYRLAEFRKQFPAASKWNIATECLHRDNETVVFKATIISPEGKAVATGHAEEKRDASFINRTSAYENCETSAIGRALAAAGFIGNEFASADELALAIQAQSGQARQAQAKPQPAQSGQASQTQAKPHPQVSETPAQPQASQAALPVAAQPAPAPAQPATQPTSQAAKPGEVKQEAAKPNSPPAKPGVEPAQAKQAVKPPSQTARQAQTCLPQAQAK
jgi:hypothetical protein